MPRVGLLNNVMSLSWSLGTVEEGLVELVVHLSYLLHPENGHTFCVPLAGPAVVQPQAPCQRLSVTTFQATSVAGPMPRLDASLHDVSRSS